MNGTLGSTGSPPCIVAEKNATLLAESSQEGIFSLAFTLSWATSFALYYAYQVCIENPKGARVSSYKNQDTDIELHEQVHTEPYSFSFKSKSLEITFLNFEHDRFRESLALQAKETTAVRGVLAMSLALSVAHIGSRALGENGYKLWASVFVASPICMSRSRLG